MKLKLSTCIVLLSMFAAACSPAAPANQEPTPDVAVIRTSAAGTVVAQFTLTAAAFTPTTASPTTAAATNTAATAQPQSIGTATATNPIIQVTNASGTPMALCDSLQFIADVTVPDGTTMSPGQDFVKTWRVKNTGSCPWGGGYRLVYASYADQMSGQAQPLTQVVQPGQEVEVSVQFTAPDEIGEYLSAWQMANPAGQEFEDIIFVKIIVE